MYGTKQSVATLTNVLAHFQADCEIIIFPPCVFIPMVNDILCDTYVHLGAQNAAAGPSGAFTGRKKFLLICCMNLAAVMFCWGTLILAAAVIS
jgi:triosephosphate isomerase